MRACPKVRVRESLQKAFQPTPSMGFAIRECTALPVVTNDSMAELDACCQLQLLQCCCAYMRWLQQRYAKYVPLLDVGICTVQDILHVSPQRTASASNSVRLPLNSPAKQPKLQTATASERHLPWGLRKTLSSSKMPLACRVLGSGFSDTASLMQRVQ